MAAERLLSENDFKSLLRAKCVEMIREEEREIIALEQYKRGTSFPFEFYNEAVRESESTISAVKELYRRVSGEDLPYERP